MDKENVGRGKGGGVKYGWGINRYKLQCVKYISYKDILYNAGNIVNVL